jgi:hypothetical protein
MRIVRVDVQRNAKLLGDFKNRSKPAGWEFSEYRDRLREKEERAKANMQIELEWLAGCAQRQDQVRALGGVDTSASIADMSVSR